MNNIHAVVAELRSGVTLATPIGKICYFARADAPEGWLICNGSLVSRGAYPALWTHAQSSGMLTDDTTWEASDEYMGKFSEGDGSTTFRLPDLRGEFLRGVDGGRGVDTGRVLGSAQADELKSHAHFTGNNRTIKPGTNSAQTLLGNTGKTEETTFEGGTETRPRNVALLPCIYAGI